MRFGLFVPQGWRLDLTGIEPADQWQAMLAVARLAEQLSGDQHSGDRHSGDQYSGDQYSGDRHSGFESVWVYDHFHTVPRPTQEATHEAWTLMAALAASTSRVRLGQMCTCMGYRNPMYLAKVAATVDVISGGRVEMGIGAGWYEHEWMAYGYGFPGAGDRLAMLGEGLEILSRAWRDGHATLAGEHYQVDGAICQPRPLQDGGIPLWVAGGGEKKTLRLAAKYAAYTNFDGSPAGFEHKSAVLAEHCRQVGRPFEEIVRSANYNVVIGRDEAEVAERFAWPEAHYRPYITPEQLAATMATLRGGPLVGTPEQIVMTLSRLRGLGLAYAITNFAEAAYDDSGIRLFAEQVIPALA